MVCLVSSTDELWKPHTRKNVWLSKVPPIYNRWMKQDSILVVWIEDGKRSKSIGHVRPSSKPLDMTELAKVKIRSVRLVRECSDGFAPTDGWNSVRLPPQNFWWYSNIFWVRNFICPYFISRSMLDSILNEKSSMYSASLSRNSNFNRYNSSIIVSLSAFGASMASSISSRIWFFL